ncbi:MAG: hypothetical protein U0350_35790 [Caldilineaceae bacterium]
MFTQKRKPKWWQLGLLAPLMVGLLILDARLTLSQWEHQCIEVGVVLLMYGSMACWLWLNQEALENEANKPGGWQRIAPETLQQPTEPLPPVETEQPSVVAYPVATLNELDDALQYALHGPLYQHTPPSGARLN